MWSSVTSEHNQQPIFFFFFSIILHTIIGEIVYLILEKWGPSWSYGSCIYNYLCNQYLSPLTLWVQIQPRRGVLDITLCDKVCQWLAAGRWFSRGTQVSSTNKTDHHDINEILLKVALNTITLTLHIGKCQFGKK